ncbi:LysR substrate-binding domain-containing protein [Dongshaea marina]|uniref:LysR substrate-binding domain-containing protein n=1 Tax=Dongshaea marina TaxID=2047966 RepID=UPI0038993BCC
MLPSKLHPGVSPLRTPDKLGARNILYNPESQSSPISLYHNDQCYELEKKNSQAINQTLVIYDLLRQGAGIGLLPDYMAEPSIANGELIQICPGWHTPGWPICLVYPYQNPTPAKLKAVLDILLESIQR